MGKSGIIARKIAATLNSTGTPALFMHPVEAVHGDLGMVVRGDAVVALSASGETEEILRLLATLKRLQVPLIAMTCDEIYANLADKNIRATRSIRRSGRCRARLLGGRGGLFAGAGPDGFYYQHARTRGCARNGAGRKAGF